MVSNIFVNPWGVFWQAARLMRPQPGLPVRPLLALAALIAAAAIGCSRRPGGAPRSEAPAPGAIVAGPRDTTGAAARAETAAVAPADTLPRYATFAITDEKALSGLARRLGPDSFAVVLALNRIDLAHARQGDTLVVPGTFDLARLSPFPDTLPAARALPKLLVVSARVQAFGAYESGRLCRWGPTSTGRQEKPTTPGLYHTNWRQRRRVSTFNDEWILNWYVNLGNFDGISLHQYELPGRPASHSCVRLLEDDAAWLYHWVETWKLVPGDRRKIAEQGTPVVVMDEYAFGGRKPWKRLPEDPRATAVAAEEIEAALGRWGVAGDALPRQAAPHDSLPH